MATNHRLNQPRCAQIMRQRAADRVDRAVCPIRIDPMLDRRPDVRKYTHAQPTRQSMLKRQRRAQRQAKRRICDGAAYLWQFEDTRIVHLDDLAVF